MLFEKTDKQTNMLLRFREVRVTMHIHNISLWGDFTGLFIAHILFPSAQKYLEELCFSI